LQALAASGTFTIVGPALIPSTPWWPPLVAAQDGDAPDFRHPPLPEDEEFDVAIVGGGVSGAYAAWRLLTGEVDANGSRDLRSTGPKPKVALFELSGRIGGRLYSVAPREMPHMRAELGGMRFVDDQLLVSALVQELGLEVQPFANGTNLFFLRGERFRSSAWDTDAPYHVTEIDPLNGRERVKSVEGIMTDLFKEVVSESYPESRGDNWPSFAATVMRPVEQAGPARWWHEFRSRATFGGRPLYEQGFWNMALQTKAVDIEGYDVLREALGYQSVPGNWNAADAIAFLWTDFANVTYYELAQGYQELPRQLAARFDRAAEAGGGGVYLHHELRSLTYPAAGDQSWLQLSLIDRHNGGAQPVMCRARHVVLALPRRAIELLDRESLLFTSSQFLLDLQAVIPQPMEKAFLGYEDAWWEDPPLAITQGGKSITDLPLRQCYYVGSEGSQPGADAENQRALLMVYNDGLELDFWRGFTLPPGPVFDEDVAEEIRAPRLMVEELQRQLREVHGPNVTIGEPYTALYINWGQDPYGGAYHHWDIGAKSWEVIPRMRQPLAAANISICGEAWSASQGWVAGALDTAERTVQLLGLLPPDWLQTDYDLGP